MLSKFSVKRPYIIVVAVIIALILGGVSLSKMKTDLLPDMDIPYLMVMTTDPGASAEKVETEVTEVLESTLSTVNGVTEIQSQSANNFSMVFLEFEDGTDMDSALVKVSSAVNEVESQLPETAGSPNYMEMSMDMMATLSPRTMKARTSMSFRSSPKTRSRLNLSASTVLLMFLWWVQRSNPLKCA